MKLAIVRQRYTPYGGAERFVARALGALERAGTEVTLIARSWEGWGARRVLRVDPPCVGSWWRDASFAAAARAAWRREGFDLVQSHERIPGCEVYRAGDGVHRRWLEIRRAASGAAGRAAIALNPHHRYLCRAERRMFEHPRLRAVICNSRMVLEEVRRGFRVAPEKLHVIYNGVDLRHFEPRERKPADAETTFLFVGSGFFRKGLAAAIQALGLAANAGWRLVVAGQDRHQARYERLAGSAGVADRVRFLGGQMDVRALYAAADCFVLPSRYDPFPNTALEALAMGVPAIVSSSCGAAEVIEPGVNGWICAPDDARALKGLMEQAAAAKGSPRMREAARETAQRFALEAMTGQLVALYDKLRA